MAQKLSAYASQLHGAKQLIFKSYA